MAICPLSSKHRNALRVKLIRKYFYWQPRCGSYNYNVLYLSTALFGDKGTGNRETHRISRIVQILTTLQSGHGYSVDDPTKILGVSRRTVFRDLKELQAIGVPYRFDSKTGGYTIDLEYFLPPVDLNLPEALSLRFSKKVVKNVSEVQWHCSQKTTQNPDGTLGTKFRVDGLGEISWWVLGYSDRVEVLRPAALRKKIKETARRMVNLNAASQIKNQVPAAPCFS